MDRQRRAMVVAALAAPTAMRAAAQAPGGTSGAASATGGAAIPAPQAPRRPASPQAEPRPLSAAATDAPPPGTDAPPLHEQRIPDLSRVLCVPEWYSGDGLYNRWQGLTVWRGATGRVRLRRKSIKQAARPLPDHTPARTYGLLIDGRRVADARFAAGQTDLEVSFPLAGLPPGWLAIGVEGLQDGESFIHWAGFHQVPGAPAPRTMPVVQGSHALAWSREPVHRWAMMPARHTPTAHPLKPQTFADVGRFVCGRLLIPTDMGQDIVTPNLSREGIWNTHGKQAYFFSDVMAGGPPVIPHVDGPRGIASAGMIIDIHIATPTKPGEPERDVEAYLMTPNAWRKLMRDGSIQTLAGWTHDQAPSHHADAAAGRTLRLVGDWSAVPAERRGYHDPWGSAWLQVETDEAAARIPSEGDLKPHRQPPIGLVADSGHGRILAHRFHPRMHGPQAVVSEWVTGLHDPFGLVVWNDEVIVSERTAHRIVAIDAATRRVRRVIVERDPARPGNARMSDWRRAMEPDGTLAERQAQPCLAPEMLRLWGDWLYYGSYAAQSIQRVHLISGERQPVLQVEIERQSWFVNFDIARDDSFAPAGTVFYCSWGQSACAVNYGVLPDGSKWTKHAGQAPWNDPQAYSAAVAVGGGRMYYAGSAMGLTRFEAGPPIDTARYRRGRELFMQEGGWLRFGAGGFNPWGLALPWGVDPDLDYYFGCHDIRRPGEPRRA